MMTKISLGKTEKLRSRIIGGSVPYAKTKSRTSIIGVCVPVVIFLKTQNIENDGENSVADNDERNSQNRCGRCRRADIE